MHCVPEDCEIRSHPKPRSARARWIRSLIKIARLGDNHGLSGSTSAGYALRGCVADIHNVIARKWLVAEGNLCGKSHT